MNPGNYDLVASVRCILETIPPGVLLLAAAKTRTLDEVESIIQAGVTHIGYNYVQEALPIIQKIGSKATWHLIGHLQRNKAKIAMTYFDMIETVDSWKLAQILENHCKYVQKAMPVLIEVNSGREANKTGVLPEAVEELAVQLNTLEYVRLNGLMTMGPRFGNPEDSRPYYKTTRAIFERIAAMKLPNVSMQHLSMGMSNSYQIAIEEGATIVRIGTKLFGDRND